MRACSARLRGRCKLFSREPKCEKNPVPLMATFFLGPHMGRAEVESRVRLNGTQRVTAVAQLSDGSFWFDAADIAVNESACLDGG
ncbi:MAG: hypothetical protein E6H70_13200 [Betaproteobacteria bacterium]|nr:MAG: hypothetical protein E6H70_13200 [Betaproteobacteria bacterium]